MAIFPRRHCLGLQAWPFRIKSAQFREISGCWHKAAIRKANFNGWNCASITWWWRPQFSSGRRFVVLLLRQGGVRSPDLPIYLACYLHFVSKWIRSWQRQRNGGTRTSRCARQVFLMQRVSSCKIDQEALCVLVKKFSSQQRRKCRKQVASQNKRIEMFLG